MTSPEYSSAILICQTLKHYSVSAMSTKHSQTGPCPGAVYSLIGKKKNTKIATRSSSLLWHKQELQQRRESDSNLGSRERAYSFAYSSHKYSCPYFMSAKTAWCSRDPITAHSLNPGDTWRSFLKVLMTLKFAPAQSTSLAMAASNLKQKYMLLICEYFLWLWVDQDFYNLLSIPLVFLHYKVHLF